MADDGESLESWLNKATNPSNRQEDWEYIMGFCDQINKELEGPQISVKLLAHKIQSPQEWEALQALTVLEACMKNCGQRFHNEVGKFRFLNELIKVVSPKYLGDKVSEKVKSKVIEMLYTWTLSLPDEAKICEAYHMLKSQGIVSADPEISCDITLLSSPSARAKNPVFDDEKKSKRLAELLKSKKPEDLQEANRLIKNMVKEDEVRSQKTTNQKRTLQAVNNSVKLLNEMLAHFSPEESTEEDKELIRELYGDCDKLRQKVFQLATETEDNDCSLGDILQASDDLSHVISSYETIVKGQAVNGETKEARRASGKQGSATQSEILIDLVDLDAQSSCLPEKQPQASSLLFPVDVLSESCGDGAAAAAEPQSQCPTALSLLDEELLSLGLSDAAVSTSQVSQSDPLSSFQNPSQDLHLFDTTSSSSSTASAFPTRPDTLSGTVAPFNHNTFPTTPSTFSVSGPVSQMHPMLTQSLPTGSVIFPQPLASGLTASAQPALPQSLSLPLPAPMSTHIPPQCVSSSVRATHSLSTPVNTCLQDLALLDLGNPKSAPLDFGALLVKSEGSSSAASLVGELQGGVNPPPAEGQTDDCLLLHSHSPIHPPNQAGLSRGQDVTLANVFVPLDSIKPSKVSPVTAYDKNSVRVLLHFASDCPAGRPDVLVMVASMLSTAPQPVRSIVLQAAVPKTMKVRLQPPSGTELAPFNPVLPPAAITQIILLANPLKEKVRMRYKLTFTLGEQPLSEVGEVDEFPSPDRWGAL